ncbi:MAG TPA: hypothetical protein VKD91_18865 [Pyrinomonadaceae bacterium]|nr:hypothetical protein [Pyrinomonadaceae bacterium]
MNWLPTFEIFGALVLLVLLAQTFRKAPLAAHAKAASQVDYAWDMMCAGTLKPIAKKLRGDGKQERSELKDTIEPCTQHVYEFSGSQGQKLRMLLADTDATAMTAIKLSRKDSGPDWDDGRSISSWTREWEGS